MNCPKCGAKNQDTASFCTLCGERFAKPRNNPRRADPVRLKKRRLLLLGVGVVLLILVLLLVYAFSGDPAEQTAKELYDAVVEMDLEAVLKTLPPAVVSELTDSLDLADSEFRVTGREDLSESRVEELDAVYGMRYGTKEGYIESAAAVYVEASYHGTSLADTTLTLIMVEVGGEWYLEPLSTAEELEKAGFAYDLSGLFS